MHRIAKLLLTLTVSVGAFALSQNQTFAQRSRTVSDPNAASNNANNDVPPPPASVEAKYEGGLIGYQKKAEGALSFDDVNRRFIFRDKANLEIMSMPYDAIISAYADTQSRRPMATQIASGVSLYALPLLLVKKKYRYLTLQFRDPDTQATGVVSYEIKNKDQLGSVLVALGNKAGLVQRGEAFIRKVPPTSAPPAPPVPTTPTPTPTPSRMEK